MNTRTIVGVALTGAVVLVSCTQDRTSAPSLPTEASLAKAPRATCDFTVMRAAAKEYFVDQRGPLYDAIDLMQVAHRDAGGGAAGNAAATDEGFVVLDSTASNVKLGSAEIKGTPELGNAFVHEVFKCMQVAGYSSSVSFTNSLGAFGLFDVVTDAVSTPVIARYNVGNSPAFGAEPNGGNWPVPGPTLFYGWKIDVSTLSGEAVKGTVADLNTLPVYSSFPAKFKAGACKVTDPLARALHQHGQDATILAPVQMSFCIGFDEDLASASGSMSSFAFGLKRAASWLAPRPLYAAMPTRPGGGGAGLVDGLSEIGPVSFVSEVSFANPPKTIKLSNQPQNPPITVLNETSNGNPLAGVLITLTVVGNSGSFTNPPVGYQATTNDDGIATFSELFIDKAGGYTITATSPLGGSAQATFNITGN